MSTPAIKRHFLDATLERFTTWCNEHELPAYRPKQVFEWVYAKAAVSFDQMTNLSKPLREMLAEHWTIYSSEIVRRQESTDGTTKLLLQWHDGATSECVLIPDDQRRTACISSQVGCPVGCKFCASGLGGLQRQLTAGQIVEQAMRVRQLCEHSPPSQPGAGGGPNTNEPRASARADSPNAQSDPPAHRLSNIVFMGLGEPLGNYAAVLDAIRIINADCGMNIGARKITVSTVGLPSQIRRLANEQLQINLALSLHAPNDELRQELIPWAEKISMADLTESIRYFFDRTGREVTMEYILLGGVNDQPSHAHELATVCRKMRCNVNLIRYNPVVGLPYERPTSYASQRFLMRLRERGINAHIRKSRGLDIDAACGQLRRANQKKSPTSLTPNVQ